MSARRPFRFGVQAVKATSRAEWVDLARRVEGWGYSTLSLADHYLGKGPAIKEAPQPLQYVAPIAAMATAAAVTTTLRVGCRVFCMDYHVPAVLAKEAATLDLLSDGRLELGIGAGWNEREYQAMGLRFASPGERFDRLVEVVELFKAHFSGELLDTTGEHVRVSGYAGLPLPVQRPHPPIMIGGGRKRVLSLAGREADIASINNVPFEPVEGLSPFEEAQRRWQWVVEAAGPRVDEVEIESSPFFLTVTDDAGAAAEQIAGFMGVEPEMAAGHPNVLVGSVGELADRLQERRESLGATYITVQQSAADAFAPVVARLAGV